jgi:hypothetical protein
MGRISSQSTFFYKRMFPIIWFGFLAFFGAIALFVGLKPSNSLPLPFFIAPPVMAILGYFIMKKLVFDFVDEVVDLGDALLVKNGNQEDRIALSDIMNINYSPLISPPRVTLSLRRPSLFGDKVSFCAPLRFVPFSTSPVIDALIARVDAARGGKRSL